MNEQTIELKIKSTAQEAIVGINKILSSLNLAKNGIEKVTTTVDKNGNETVKVLSNIEKKGQGVYKVLQQIDKDGNLKTVSTSFSSLNSSIEKASKSMSKLKNLFTFVGAKRLTTTTLSWINEGVDYTEQLNLFNVVFDNVEKNGKTMFSNLGKEATRFQYKLNETFGTNKTQSLYMQGIYQSMGETVDIPKRYAAIMSETTTKLTYDLASLFNKQETATAEALRAGIYAGQTKPLRAYGIDVTQMSMQPILDSLGIDRQVKEMSQAEKEILRYLATLNQAKIAMGDLANTIESPSNQMKIFRQQLVETKTALSSLFMGAYANILPYANAILMVIKEISKAIADMFGIKLVDYNSGIASQEGIYDGIADSVDNAIEAVKEFKRQTLGFDEIHNINENNDSGSSSSLVGGIDQRLLDAIKGYDNGMDKVRMKATEIRDRIMEWLGFTKEIDPLTGEVKFKFLDTESTLYKIITALKDIYDYGKKIVGDVLSQIMKDLNSGLFGDIIVTILEGIGKALKFISENESAVKTITNLVEAFIIWKGLGLTSKVLGLDSIIDGIGNMWGKLGDTSSTKKTSDALENMSSSGKKSIGSLLNSKVDGVTALKLGLVALTETAYIVHLGVDGYNETKKAIETTTDVSQQLRDSTKEVIDRFTDAQDTMDKTSNEYQNLSEQIITTTRKLANNNETMEKSKNWFTDLTWQTEKYSIQQRENQRVIDDSTNSLAKMVHQGDINIEMFEKFANEVGYSSEYVDAFKEKISDSNTNLSDLDNLVQNFKTDKIQKGFNELKGPIDNSVIAVDTLTNKINNMNSKSITLSVNADMSQAERSISNSLVRLSTNMTSQITNIWNGIIGKANGGIYSNGSWKNIPQYANGGAPSHGSMFVAGEHGAEIVGHINGKTEVLNQSQIASAIYSAVASAMSQYSGQASEIDVHVHTDEGTVIDRIEQRTKQTGQFPFTIPTY